MPTSTQPHRISLNVNEKPFLLHRKFNKTCRIAQITRWNFFYKDFMQKKDKELALDISD